MRILVPYVLNSSEIVYVSRRRRLTRLRCFSRSITGHFLHFHYNYNKFKN